MGFCNGEKGYLLITLGCQMNEHDSEVIAAILENAGCYAVSNAEDANLIIINTCAVRKKPEDKVTSLLGKLTTLKNENKDLLIAVGGCMTQQSEIAAYIKDRFHCVDLIFGTHSLPRLLALLEEAARSNGTIVDIDEDYCNREELPVKPGRTFQAWMPIIYGCNNYCSYCVVPYVRGHERSREFNRIINDARDLVDRGYLEITLLGQNVNSYGHDLKDKRTFVDLLAALNELRGLKRIRFMTSHPKDLSPQLIEIIRNGEKICEHIHLPVQSGSNSILEKMNRQYSREKYLELVAAIRAAIPGASVTSDIIVGFPGETEADFKATLDLVQKARFDNAFTFIYSPRKNTAAMNFADILSYHEKELRLKEANNIQHAISREINNFMLGRTVEVLVEGPSKSKPDLQTGRTRTNKLVHFKGHDGMTGKMIMARILESQTWNLVGEMVNENSK